MKQIEHVENSPGGDGGTFKNAHSLKLLIYFSIFNQLASKIENSSKRSRNYGNLSPVYCDQKISHPTMFKIPVRSQADIPSSQMFYTIIKVNVDRIVMEFYIYFGITFLWVTSIDIDKTDMCMDVR